MNSATFSGIVIGDPTPKFTHPSGGEVPASCRLKLGGDRGEISVLAYFDSTAEAIAALTENSQVLVSGRINLNAIEREFGKEKQVRLFANSVQVIAQGLPPSEEPLF